MAAAPPYAATRVADSNRWTRAGATPGALGFVAPVGVWPSDGPGGPVCWSSDGRAAFCMVHAEASAARWAPAAAAFQEPGAAAAAAATAAEAEARAAGRGCGGGMGARSAAFMGAGRARVPYSRALAGAGAAAMAPPPPAGVFGSHGANVSVSGCRVSYRGGGHGSGSWAALRVPARRGGGTVRLVLERGSGDVWAGVCELPLPPDAHASMCRRAWVVNLGTGWAYGGGRIVGCTPGWDAGWAVGEVVDVVYDRAGEALRLVRDCASYDAASVRAGDDLGLVMSWVVCPNAGNTVAVLDAV